MYISELDVTNLMAILQIIMRDIFNSDFTFSQLGDTGSFSFVKRLVSGIIHCYIFVAMQSLRFSLLLKYCFYLYPLLDVMRRRILLQYPNILY